MAKEPAARYATAQELADDLRRFLEDQPIRARRPSLAGPAGEVVAAAPDGRGLRFPGPAPLCGRPVGRPRPDRSRARPGLGQGEGSVGERQEARERTIELERQLYMNRVNHAFGEWRESNIALADRLLQECPRALRGLGVGLLPATLPPRAPDAAARRPAIPQPGIPPRRSWLVTAAEGAYPRGSGARRMDALGPGDGTRDGDPADAREPIRSRVDPSGTLLAVGPCDGR